MRHRLTEDMVGQQRSVYRCGLVISCNARRWASNAVLPLRVSESHITRRASFRPADAVLREETYPASVRVLICFESVASDTSRESRSRAKSIRSACRRSPQVRSRSGAWIVSSKRASVTTNVLHRTPVSDSGQARRDSERHETCDHHCPTHI